MKILIAEDQRIPRRTLQRQLEKWGHEVVAAEDGEVAWACYEEQEPDQRFEIVVTDWEMPRCDGRELVERIRAAGDSGYVYLIMLTSRAEKTDIVSGMEAGADDFLTKPFDREELRVRLNAGERIIRLERALAAQNAALENANKRMTRDLDAAADVQQGLLPLELPATPHARFAWHYEPCDEIGGDIFNVIALDDRHTGMYLLDVSGHGVPAALLSVTLSRVLTTRDPSSSVLFSEGHAGATSFATPSQVIARLNRQFPMESLRGRYFTMVYGILEHETGRVRYSLAGHPAPIVVRPSGAELLSGTGFPVGIVPDADFDEYDLQLEAGDRLLLYSDGINEAMNGDNAMLGTDGFLKLLDASRDQTLESSLAAFMKGLEAYTHPVPFGDDVSMLVLERPCAD